jgi:hypothetical protein
MPNYLGHITPLLSDFTYGELSPKMLGRSETNVYHKGAQTVQNMVPMIQGGFRKRTGSLMIENTLGDVTAQIYRMVINQNLWYLLEFTNLMLRIWGNMNTTPSVVQTVTTPYLTADLVNLQMGWAYPDLFIANSNYAPAMLEYVSLNTFVFVNPIPIVGSAPSYFTGTLALGNKTISAVTPDPTQNPLLAVVLGGTLTNGRPTITLPTLDPTQQAFSLIGMPIAGTGIGAGVTIIAVTSSSLTMSANYGGTTGAYLGLIVSHAGIPVSGFIAPIGTSPAGIAPNSKLASVTSSTIVMDTNANGTGTITNGIAISQDSALPFQTSGNYPGVVTCANQRVLWAASVNDPQEVWASVVEIFDTYGSMFMQFFEDIVYTVQTMSENASGQPLDSSGNVVTAAAGNTPAYTSTPQYQQSVGDADGFTGQIYSDQNDAIQWIVSATDIIIGTLSGQVLIPGDSTANTFSFRNISRTGCANIQAYFMTGGVLFVDRAARRVMLLNWQGVNIQLLPPDTLSIFSDHLFLTSASSINQIEFSTSPVMRLWFLQNDGTLVGCEYDDKYDCRAWWNYVTNGTIVSICVGQGPTEDVLYLVVNRNGHYIIEQVTTLDWTSESGQGGVLPAVFTDASVYQYNATPFTVVTGLTNLNGMTVQMVGDGMYLGTAVVSGGQVTLPNGGTYPASYNTAIVGLGYTSVLETMPIETGVAQDSGVGKELTIPRVVLQFLNTLYAEVIGVQGGNPEISDYTAGQTTFPTPYTGTSRSPMPSGFAFGSSVTVQSSKPLPLMVTAIIPEVTGYE